MFRDFLNSLVIHLRGTKENPNNPGEVLSQNISQPANNPKPDSIKPKPMYKVIQHKNVNQDIDQVKYKNKKKS